jgi:DNA-directed RNA polymerase specialized sigma24 family protein
MSRFKDLIDHVHLIRQCSSGCPLAWRCLHDTYRGQLLRRVRDILGWRAVDEDLVEEIVQRVWCSAFISDGLKTYSGRGEVLAFLVGIARQQVRIYQRSERRHRMCRLPSGWDRAVCADIPPSLNSLIAEFMDKLPPQRRAFCASQLRSMEDGSSGVRYSMTALRKMKERTRTSLHQFAKNHC